MSGIGDGGRAFPSGAVDPLFVGMTLWDWFAIMASDGMLTNATLPVGITAERCAQNAYLIAHAMLSERAKGVE